MNAALSSRRYLWTYLGVLALLVAASFVAHAQKRNYRANPVDFNTMADGSYIPTTQLTRLQREEIRLGFIEKADPFRVGIFGNHQVNLMARSSFGPNTKRNYFFNYAYANLGLPEVLDYLSYLSDRKKLPTDTVIVQITTPNNDRGMHILTYAYELPPDVARYATASLDLGAHDGYGDREQLQRNLIRYDYMTPWIKDFPILERYYETLSTTNKHIFLRVEGVIQEFAYFVHQSLSFTTVGSTLAAVLRRGADVRVVDGANCTETTSDTLLKAFYSGVACTKADLRWAFRNDGSFDQRYQFWKPLTLNENDANDVSPFLKDGDEVVIASLMDRICKLVTEQGRKCVFLIPPVYETPRSGGADKIVDKALALVPHVPVIDDRPIRDRQYFHDYDHPNATYFQRLASVLRERGFVPQLD